MLFRFPRCRVLQVGYSGAHSTGLSLTSLWAHPCQLQMFLKPLPTLIITLYPFLLLELLTALNPSLPPYRLLSWRTFLVKLNLWFHSHQKKPLQKDSHEAAMQGTRKHFSFWKHMENGSYFSADKNHLKYHNMLHSPLDQRMPHRGAVAHWQ